MLSRLLPLVHVMQFMLLRQLYAALKPRQILKLHQTLELHQTLTHATVNSQQQISSSHHMHRVLHP
jgi:hypothetical protein